MLHKMLDRLLNLHFKKPTQNKHLDVLEQDVWRRIHAASANIVQPWYDKIALAFAVPEFRVVSLALALVIGVSASPVFTPNAAVISNGDMLGMNVFTVQSPYLPSTIIGRMK